MIEDRWPGTGTGTMEEVRDGIGDQGCGRARSAVAVGDGRAGMRRASCIAVRRRTAPRGRATWDALRGPAGDGAHATARRAMSAIARRAHDGGGGRRHSGHTAGPAGARGTVGGAGDDALVTVGGAGDDALVTVGARQWGRRQRSEARGTVGALICLDFELLAAGPTCLSQSIDRLCAVS